MLLLDGAEHLRQRRLLLPPFHGERMQAYGETMREVAERQSPPGRAATRSPSLPSMQAITLEVILRAVFGLDDAGAARADRRAAAAPARRRRQPPRACSPCS